MRLGVLSGPTPRTQRCSLALPPASLEGQRSTCPGRKPWHQGSECPSLEGAFWRHVPSLQTPVSPAALTQKQTSSSDVTPSGPVLAQNHIQTQKTAIKEDTKNSSLYLNFKTTRGIKVRTHSNTSHQSPHTLLPHPTHPSPGPLCIPSSSPSSRPSSGTSSQPPACASPLPFLPSSVSHAHSSGSSQFKIWDQAGTWWVEGRSGVGNVPAAVPNMQTGDLAH